VVKESRTYIAATDADVCDADEHIMRVDQFWNLFVFELRFFGTVKDYRRILHFGGSNALSVHCSHLIERLAGYGRVSKCESTI
jgi:hypothetical protein